MKSALSFSIATICLFVCGSAGAVDSGDLSKVQAELLGKCVVLKSTGQDRLTFGRGMLAAMAAGPQLADVAKIDMVKKQELDVAVAKIFTRLLTVDCLKEAKPLAATNPKLMGEIVGETLGTISMQELLTDKETLASLEAYAAYLEPNDFIKLK
jgi:hypothetical protein